MLLVDPNLDTRAGALRWLVACSPTSLGSFTDLIEIIQLPKQCGGSSQSLYTRLLCEKRWPITWPYNMSCSNCREQTRVLVTPK
ncbi:hypothetical protein PoB_000537200 [Plakobranchus ocellatus]|uniref:Uncharacterized protein n=1 Tax=Plakobranchus ocellatus TaxID=259542 RepID=A0AAV3Y8R2_9GAST|nr:hypothetical protein PoB_000537200 [Plakobranchus ocellatus]